jgi:GNAT superfamily N-acetyltransferase
VKGGPDTRRPVLPVHTAAPREAHLLGATLAEAFLDDPVWSWLTPDPERRHRGFPGMFTALARHRAAEGTAWTTPGCSGVALWAAPGRWCTPWWVALPWAPAALRAFGTGDGLRRAMASLAEMERHHPTEPHWYLEVLGTDPSMQGRGVGAAVLAPVLERCDRDGLPAYLESSKAENVPWYERHGFAVVAELRARAGAPPSWTMRRDPR